MPGGGARRDGVHDERGVGSLPRVDEPAGLLFAFDDVDARRHATAEPRRDRQPGAVVAAVLVADADHHMRHRRSTSSVRKCVAQEMHGS